MKFVGLLLLTACGLLLAASPSQRAGWRGIVPLHSTRADVERLIGEPNVDGWLHAVGGERAHITYARGPCTGGLEGAYKVPPDTVVSIHVRPPNGLRLADLRLDPSRYKKSGGAPGADLAGYESEEDGIVYVAYEGGAIDGEIRAIIYGPAAADAHLRCADPAGPPDRAGSEPSEGSEGPRGECPTVAIERSAGGTFRAGEYSLSASISGGDPRFTPTFKWAVSAGVIVGGQGTGVVKVAASDAGGRPIAVTLEVGGIIPRRCPNVQTYTIERAQPH